MQPQLFEHRRIHGRRFAQAHRRELGSVAEQNEAAVDPGVDIHQQVFEQTHAPLGSVADHRGLVDNENSVDMRILVYTGRKPPVRADCRCTIDLAVDGVGRFAGEV